MSEAQQITYNILMLIGAWFLGTEFGKFIARLIDRKKSKNSMKGEQKIIFQGNEYIFINMASEGFPVYGAITTVEAYRNVQESFAHLHPDGKISRHGSIIGDRDDIEFTSKFIEVMPDTEKAIQTMLTGRFNP